MPTLPKQPMKKQYKKDIKALNKKLKQYLKSEGIRTLDAKVPNNQLKNLLLLFIGDFLNYNLFFDEFSSLCEEILVVLYNRETGDRSDLFMICHYGTELNWYIRNEPSRAAEFLQAILDFYKKNTQSL